MSEATNIGVCCATEQEQRRVNALRLTAYPSIQAALIACMANCGNCDPSGSAGPTCPACQKGRSALALAGLTSNDIDGALAQEPSEDAFADVDWQAA